MLHGKGVFVSLDKVEYNGYWDCTLKAGFGIVKFLNSKKEINHIGWVNEVPDRPVEIIKGYFRMTIHILIFFRWKSSFLLGFTS